MLNILFRFVTYRRYQPIIHPISNQFELYLQQLKSKIKIEINIIKNEFYIQNSPIFEASYIASVIPVIIINSSRIISNKMQNNDPTMVVEFLDICAPFIFITSNLIYVICVIRSCLPSKMNVTKLYRYIQSSHSDERVNRCKKNILRYLENKISTEGTQYICKSSDIDRRKYMQILGINSIIYFTNTCIIGTAWMPLIYESFVTYHFPLSYLLLTNMVVTKITGKLNENISKNFMRKIDDIIKDDLWIRR